MTKFAELPTMHPAVAELLGVNMATLEILHHYQALDDRQKRIFFKALKDNADGFDSPAFCAALKAELEEVQS